MMSRSAEASRETRETKVRVALDLDGSGRSAVSTGVGFLDHLLGSLAHHALFDLEIEATGDLEVDDHHTVEDVALVLGEAIALALGDRSGITRFGDAVVPMDEAIARASVDAGGRPFAFIELEMRNERIGNLTTQNLPHALEALCRASEITLHLEAKGLNDHHIAEAAFKALARSLRGAVEMDSRRQGIPSTKGVL
jgi:imidazoleglycerol-phosphate dehydratase